MLQLKYGGQTFQLQDVKKHEALCKHLWLKNPTFFMACQTTKEQASITTLVYRVFQKSLLIDPQNRFLSASPCCPLPAAWPPWSSLQTLRWRSCSHCCRLGRCRHQTPGGGSRGWLAREGRSGDCERLCCPESWGEQFTYNIIPMAMFTCLPLKPRSILSNRQHFTINDIFFRHLFFGISRGMGG